MKKTMTVRLPDDLYEDLKEISCSTRKTASAIVLEALRRYIAILKFRQLRNNVLPYAESRRLLTDEDIFKIVS